MYEILHNESALVDAFRCELIQARILIGAFEGATGYQELKQVLRLMSSPSLSEMRQPSELRSGVMWTLRGAMYNSIVDIETISIASIDSLDIHTSVSRLIYSILTRVSCQLGGLSVKLISIQLTAS